MTTVRKEGNGWYGEEVHGYDGIAMIAKESRPELAGLVVRRQAADIAGDRTFGDVQAEFQKFTMNSRSAPGGILLHHAADESSKLGIDYWPAKPLWP